ncbi:Glycolipid transfer protein [Fukomys damarensis]|uniref:Glycolipid transfer protein n=1 Tax=Fukomys damarensis TaxID=885580 RepID=A0A091D0Q9_FUKDA|nr:Glycolipid transfer protein [Fukomys damarensis]
MALLAEHLLKPLPADKQIETGPFLEAVSHLPPFFEGRNPQRASLIGPEEVQQLCGHYCATFTGEQSVPRVRCDVLAVTPSSPTLWSGCCTVTPLGTGPSRMPGKGSVASQCRTERGREEDMTKGSVNEIQRVAGSQLDCLGSPVFMPIKADISGNITKIKAVYDTNPAKFRTLQNILEVEKEMYGTEWPKVGATLALMWLKRGLRFIQVFLQSICDGERDENHPNHIRVNATKAYEMALKKYHGWLVQKIFHAALYAAPYKSDFLKALSKGQNVTEEECLEKIRLFLVNYTATIDVIYEMYTKMNAELNYKV